MGQLQGSQNDWTHGARNGNWVGSAYYGGWVTEQSQNPVSSLYQASSSAWVVLCTVSSQTLSLAYVDNYRWAGNTAWPPGNAASASSWYAGWPGNIGFNIGQNTAGNFGVLELMSWNRTLSYLEISNTMAYLQLVAGQAGGWVSTIPNSIVAQCNNESANNFPVSTNSMVSWFKHSNLTYGNIACNSSQPQWISNVNWYSFTMAVVGGVATIAGTCPQIYLSGTLNTQISFGPILGSNGFTLCSATKYTGTNKNAMITASNNVDWEHGARDSSSVGAAYYGGTWMTPGAVTSSLYQASSSAWVVLCVASSSSSSLAYVDYFKWVGNSNPAQQIPGTNSGNWQGSYAGSIGVNLYRSGSGSDFGVLELMSWNRTLGYTEISNAMAYIQVVAQQTSGWVSAVPITPIIPCSNESMNFFPINTSAMISWFQHSNLTYGCCDVWSSQPQWSSNVNSSFQVTVMAGIATIAGTCPQRYLSGTYLTQFDFGPILGSGAFTLCTVTKFTDSSHLGTLFVSSLNRGSWWHGANNGNYIGGAYYGGWVSSQASPVTTQNLPWLVLCTASSSSASWIYVDNFRWVGNNGQNIPGNVASSTSWAGSYPGNIQINTYASLNPSSVGVLEIMSFGRVLSSIEISNAMAYLQVVANQESSWVSTASNTTAAFTCSSSCLNIFPTNTSGMISWFQNANLSYAGLVPWSSQVVWNSNMNSFSLTVLTGVSTTSSACPRYLIASYQTQMDFGPILGTSTFSFCSVTKFGTNKNAMLVGSQNKGSWYHGASSNGQNLGNAYYGNGYITSQRNPASLLPWIALCVASGSTSSLAYVDNFVWNGNNGQTIPGNPVGGWQGNYPGNIQINTYASLSPSDVGVVELMSWNRMLSSLEIANVMGYLDCLTTQMSTTTTTATSSTSTGTTVTHAGAYTCYSITSNATLFQNWVDMAGDDSGQFMYGAADAQTYPAGYLQNSALWYSHDYGRSYSKSTLFNTTYSTGQSYSDFWAAIFTNANGSMVFAAAAVGPNQAYTSGYCVLSTDYGVTFRLVGPTPGSSATIPWAAACSRDLQVCIITNQLCANYQSTPGCIAGYRSTDYANTWTAMDYAATFGTNLANLGVYYNYRGSTGRAAAVSPNGQYAVACSIPGSQNVLYVAVSVNGGTTYPISVPGIGYGANLAVSFLLFDDGTMYIASTAIYRVTLYPVRVTTVLALPGNGGENVGGDGWSCYQAHHICASTDQSVVLLTGLNAYYLSENYGNHFQSLKIPIQTNEYYQLSGCWISPNGTTLRWNYAGVNYAGNTPYMQECGYLPPTTTISMTTTATSSTVTPCSEEEDTYPVALPVLSWFQHQNVSTSWPSTYGGFAFDVRPGQYCCGDPAYISGCPMKYFYGGSTTSVFIGAILGKGSYTICSVTKYNGVHRERILQCTGSNCVFGQFGGWSGVAYYGSGWMTPQGSTSSAAWLVMCGTNDGKLYVDEFKFVGTGATNGVLGNTIGNVVINGLGPTANPVAQSASNWPNYQISDFAIRELVTWNRSLTLIEIANAMQYLNVLTHQTSTTTSTQTSATATVTEMSACPYNSTVPTFPWGSSNQCTSAICDASCSRYTATTPCHLAGCVWMVPRTTIARTAPAAQLILSCYTLASPLSPSCASKQRCGQHGPIRLRSELTASPPLRLPQSTTFRGFALALAVAALGQQQISELATTSDLALLTTASR